jgi:1,2-phenylacetyl-CoA epoxidase catalytic subunit
MAEELRHGYQMFHLLTQDDWAKVAGQDPDDFIEEVLSMKTGSHVLGAFNIEYDSFVDSVVFAAVIDRVGKYQLTMQKVCAYKPMAASMPPMLQEEAFHLAAGVLPLRKWVRKAASGDVRLGMRTIQRYLNKWLPRGYEMFGDERGGQTNIATGFKDLTNRQAVDMYRGEIQRMIDDLNKNYVRAKLPKLSGPEAESLAAWLLEHKEEKDGICWSDLLTEPDERFFRRRGMWSHQMWTVDGQEITDRAAYEEHLAEELPEPYLAHRDFGNYLLALDKLAAGEIDRKEAESYAPKLRRMSQCPCSKAVRWIVEDGEGGCVEADNVDEALAAVAPAGAAADGNGNG